MKIKSLAWVLSPLCFCANVYADYFTEIGATYTDLSFDYDIDNQRTISRDRTIKLVSSSFYLSPVTVGTKPISESGFLSQHSSVSLTVGNQEDDGSSDGASADVSIHQLDGRFILPSTNTILLLGYAAYDDDSRIDGEGESITVGGGVYLSKSKTLTLSYSRLDYESEDDDFHSIELQYYQVSDLDSGHVAYGLRYENQEGGDVDFSQDLLDADLTYYPNQRLGIGCSLRFRNYTTDLSDFDEYGIAPFVSYDFNENLGVGFQYLVLRATDEYDHYLYPDIDQDTEGYRLIVVARL